MASKNAAQAAAKTGLAELAKRVPPSQALQFKVFSAKHAEYQARVQKQPEKLPAIDWDFYRRNVRAENIKWVDEFEQKYKAVSCAFDERGKQDTSKYFVELQKLREQVQCEVKEYIAESNERIKALEVEYARVKALKPYEEMTAEEYSELLPDKSMFMYKGEPSFWPHTPEEQGPGLSYKDAHGHGDGDATKPPPTEGSTSGGGGSGGDGGSAASGEKSVAPEKTESKEKSDTKEGKDVAKTTPKAQNESERVAQAINAVVLEKQKQAVTDPCLEAKKEHSVEVIDASKAASDGMSSKDDLKSSKTEKECELEDPKREIALKK